MEKQIESKKEFFVKRRNYYLLLHCLEYLNFEEFIKHSCTNRQIFQHFKSNYNIDNKKDLKIIQQNLIGKKKQVEILKICENYYSTIKNKPCLKNYLKFFFLLISKVYFGNELTLHLNNIKDLNFVKSMIKYIPLTDRNYPLTINFKYYNNFNFSAEKNHASILFPVFGKNSDLKVFLTSLDLSNAKINNESLNFLKPFLKCQNKRLKFLNLKNNNLGGNSPIFDDYLKFLKSDKSLQEINFQNNTILDDSIRRLVKIILSDKNKITNIFAQFNFFTYKSVNYLSELTKEHQLVKQTKKLFISYKASPFFILKLKPERTTLRVSFEKKYHKDNQMCHTYYLNYIPLTHLKVIGYVNMDSLTQTITSNIYTLEKISLDFHSLMSIGCLFKLVKLFESIKFRKLKCVSITNNCENEIFSYPIDEDGSAQLLNSLVRLSLEELLFDNVIFDDEKISSLANLITNAENMSVYRFKKCVMNGAQLSKLTVYFHFVKNKKIIFECCSFHNDCEDLIKEISSHYSNISFIK